MKNEQSFTDMGNSKVLVNVEKEKKNKTMNDSFQLMAFDTSKKINSLFLIVCILLIVNIITLFFITRDVISTRQQYDKLHYMIEKYEKNLEKLEDLLNTN